MTNHDMTTLIATMPVSIKPVSNISFMPDGDKPWIMRLSVDNGIEFNQEDYPLSKPDDFAQAVIDILERNFIRTFIREGLSYEKKMESE